METLKVSAKSVTTSVAGAIAGVIRENGEVEIQAVGAGATNQAVKSIAVAKSYLVPECGIVCIPDFVKVKINDEERTAISFVVKAVEK